MSSRSVKREWEATGEGSGRRETDESGRTKKMVKKEKLSKSGFDSVRPQEPPVQEEEQVRALRSQYRTLTHKINNTKDVLSAIDSKQFHCLINEFENLHRNVQKPREQITDAEALLDLTNTLVSSVRSQYSNGVTPAEFVNAFIRGFGESSIKIGTDDVETMQVSMKWKEIGFAVCSSGIVSCGGCSTMLGPMDSELKQRKRTVGNRKRTKLGAGVKPEEVDETEADKKTDTDKNMAIMFKILKMNKRVKVENLVLNRRSFAQTVENLFALSFLVKDGRVEIIIDKNGSHFAVPRNAPEANLVMSGGVVYNHFVFRFDYKDWQPMSTMVVVGEELMPHRGTKIASKRVSQNSQTNNH